MSKKMKSREWDRRPTFAKAELSNAKQGDI